MTLNSSWALEELAKVNFGDKRLDKRFLKVAASQGKSPQLSINASSEDWSCVKGAYRMFSNPKVTPEKILEPHFENTVHRIYGQSLAIIVQDTTFIDFSTHEMVPDLGSNGGVPGYETKGIHFHAGLALSHEGTPLGLMYSKIWTRFKQKAKGHAHRKIPITSKESYRWLECLEQTKALLPSGTRGLVLADRECDIYEYFELAQDLDLDVLVRLQHNRVLVDELGESTRVEDVFRDEKIRGHLDIHVPGNGSRVARDARMAVKYREVCFEGNPRGVKVPRTRERKNIVVNIIELFEVDAPEGSEALGWTLITTLPVSSVAEAEDVMKFYRMRWTIELYFKALKTGCNVEKCRLEESSKLQKFIALCGIIAWRLMWLTWLQREIPYASGELAITQTEWKTLWLKKHREKIKAGVMTAEPPDEIPDLCTITRWIAGFGGFLNRKGDGHPGLITISRGWIRIMDGAEIYELMAPK
jgi:hypothetical protein